MDDSKNMKTCSEHPTCLFRIEALETWKEGIEKKMNGLMKLLIANLGGVILTLVSVVAALLMYIAQQ